MSGESGASEPPGVRQRGLRILRPGKTPMHGLRGPAETMPHVAVLGLNGRDSGRLGGNLQGLPWLREGPTLLGQGDSQANQDDPRLGSVTFTN